MGMGADVQARDAMNDQINTAFCPGCLADMGNPFLPSFKHNCPSCGRFFTIDETLSYRVAQRRMDKRKEDARTMDKELKENPLFIRNDA